MTTNAEMWSEKNKRNFISTKVNQSINLCLYLFMVFFSGVSSHLFLIRYCIVVLLLNVHCTPYFLIHFNVGEYVYCLYTNIYHMRSIYLYYVWVVYRCTLYYTSFVYFSWSVWLERSSYFTRWWDSLNLNDMWMRIHLLNTNIE